MTRDAFAEGPIFMLKIIPHVDGTPRICKLVRYLSGGLVLKEPDRPAALGLFPHALADVALLHVRSYLGAAFQDRSLRLAGNGAFDYMAKLRRTHPASSPRMRRASGKYA